MANRADGDRGWDDSVGQLRLGCQSMAADGPLALAPSRRTTQTVNPYSKAFQVAFFGSILFVGVTLVQIGAIQYYTRKKKASMRWHCTWPWAQPSRPRLVSRCPVIHRRSSPACWSSPSPT